MSLRSRLSVYYLIIGVVDPASKKTIAVVAIVFESVQSGLCLIEHAFGNSVDKADEVTDGVGYCVDNSWKAGVTIVISHYYSFDCSIITGVFHAKRKSPCRGPIFLPATFSLLRKSSVEANLPCCGLEIERDHLQVHE